MELEVSMGDKIEGPNANAGRALSLCLVGVPKASCAGSWRDATWVLS